MKFLVPLSAIFAIIVNCGCSHTEVSTTGFKTTNTNMDWVEWSPTSFKASKLNTSVPLGATWRGITRTSDIIKDTALALTPQTQAAPLVLKGAGIIGTKFNNPTTIQP